MVKQARKPQRGLEVRSGWEEAVAEVLENDPEDSANGSAPSSGSIARRQRRGDPVLLAQASIEDVFGALPPTPAEEANPLIDFSAPYSTASPKIIKSIWDDDEPMDEPPIAPKEQQHHHQHEPATPTNQSFPPIVATPTDASSAPLILLDSTLASRTQEQDDEDDDDEIAQHERDVSEYLREVGEAKGSSGDDIWVNLLSSSTESSRPSMDGRPPTMASAVPARSDLGSPWTLTGSDKSSPSPTNSHDDNEPPSLRIATETASQTALKVAPKPQPPSMVGASTTTAPPKPATTRTAAPFDEAPEPKESLVVSEDDDDEPEPVVDDFEDEMADNEPEIDMLPSDEGFSVPPASVHHEDSSGISGDVSEFVNRFASPKAGANDLDDILGPMKSEQKPKIMPSAATSNRMDTVREQNSGEDDKDGRKRPATSTTKAVSHSGPTLVKDTKVQEQKPAPSSAPVQVQPPPPPPTVSSKPAPKADPVVQQASQKELEILALSSLSSPAKKPKTSPIVPPAKREPSLDEIKRSKAPPTAVSSAEKSSPRLTSESENQFVYPEENPLDRIAASLNRLPKMGAAAPSAKKARTPPRPLTTKLASPHSMTESSGTFDSMPTSPSETNLSAVSKDSASFWSSSPGATTRSTGTSPGTTPGSSPAAARETSKEAVRETSKEAVRETLKEAGYHKLKSTSSRNDAVSDSETEGEESVQQGGRLWQAAHKEAEQMAHRPSSPEASRFAESLMARTRSRATPDAVLSPSSTHDRGMGFCVYL